MSCCLPGLLARREAFFVDAGVRAGARQYDGSPRSTCRTGIRPSRPNSQTHERSLRNQHATQKVCKLASRKRRARSAASVQAEPEAWGSPATQIDSSAGTSGSSPRVSDGFALGSGATTERRTGGDWAAVRTTDAVADGLDRLAELGRAQDYNINVDHGDLPHTLAAVMLCITLNLDKSNEGQTQLSIYICSVCILTSYTSSNAHRTLHHFGPFFAGQSIQHLDYLFVGNFLGKKSDIASGALRDYEARSFGNIQGDYYVAPKFLEAVAVISVYCDAIWCCADAALKEVLIFGGVAALQMHITKNFLCDQGAIEHIRVPLIL
eukprot:scaffold297805_cov41-Prasinocladus_malaysianus.AAC.2